MIEDTLLRFLYFDKLKMDKEIESSINKEGKGETL